MEKNCRCQITRPSAKEAVRNRARHEENSRHFPNLHVLSKRDQARPGVLVHVPVLLQISIIGTHNTARMRTLLGKFPERHYRSGHAGIHRQVPGQKAWLPTYRPTYLPTYIHAYGDDKPGPPRAGIRAHVATAATACLEVTRRRDATSYLLSKIVSCQVCSATCSPRLSMSVPQSGAQYVRLVLVPFGANQGYLRGGAVRLRL